MITATAGACGTQRAANACACSSYSHFANEFPRQRGVSHSVETDAQQRLLTVYFSSGVTLQTLDPGFRTARSFVASLCAMRPRPTACIRLRMRLLSVTRRRLPRRFFLPTDPWRRSRHACSSTTHIAQRPQYIYSTAILPSSQHRTLLWRGIAEEGCGIFGFEGVCAHPRGAACSSGGCDSASGGMTERKMGYARSGPRAG